MRSRAIWGSDQPLRSLRGRRRGGGGAVELADFGSFALRLVPLWFLDFMAVEQARVRVVTT